MAADKNFIIFSDAHLHNWSAFGGADSEGRNIRLMHIINEIKRHADYAKQKGIDTIYGAGDLFHTRGRVSPSVLNPALDLFKSITDSGITVRMIPGNHDLESDKTNRLSNASAALEGVGVELAHEPMYYMDNDVLMVPWNPDSAELLNTLQQARSTCTEETDVIIHAPVNGVILGIPDHGIYPSELSALGYKRVFVGHYHAFKEFEGGVYSVGATTHQTWNDPGTLAGAIEVSGDEVHHRPTEAPMFIDLNGLTESQIEEQTPGNYVRLKIGEASESDIKVARQELEQLGALGVVIQSTPATKIVKRTTSVKAGGRIEGSIDSWVDQNLPAADKKAVTKEALDVLSSVEDDE